MVIALITLIASVVTLQISKALKKERFEQGVESVLAKLALAQELMLDFHTDVRVCFEKQGEILSCTLTTNLSLPPHLESSINRYSKISGVSSIAFNGVPKAHCELLFDGTLGSVPVGTLTLSKETKEESIFLNGYPAHFKRGKNEEKHIRPAIYPEEAIKTPFDIPFVR